MSDIAAHEARHASVALMYGLDVTEVSTIPSTEAAGYVSIGGIGNGMNREQARSFVLQALAGPFGLADWPPTWPPSKTARTKDERQIAEVVSQLGLDEAGWRDLCDEARGAVARSARLQSALASLLDPPCTLDERSVKSIYATTEADMQFKTAEMRTVAKEAGEFEAIAAAYTVDRVRDQIMPGAFQKTIARWQASQKFLPLHWNHESNPASIIGQIDPARMREVEQGLYVAGQLDLEHSEVAREAWRSMKSHRVFLSFGYLTTKSHKRADGVTELHELDVFEVSIVGAPSNADTHFLSFKSAPADGLTERERKDIERQTAYITQILSRDTKAAPKPLKIASFDCTKARNL